MRSSASWCCLCSTHPTIGTPRALTWGAIQVMHFWCFSYCLCASLHLTVSTVHLSHHRPPPRVLEFTFSDVHLFKHRVHSFWTISDSLGPWNYFFVESEVWGPPLSIPLWATRSLSTPLLSWLDPRGAQQKVSSGFLGNSYILSAASYTLYSV